MNEQQIITRIEELTKLIEYHNKKYFENDALPEAGVKEG